MACRRIIADASLLPRSLRPSFENISSAHSAVPKATRISCKATCGERFMFSCRKPVSIIDLGSRKSNRSLATRASVPLIEALSNMPHAFFSVGTGPLLGDVIAKPHEALGIQLPLFVQLAGLVLVNVLGVQAVGKALQVVQDRNDQISIVKVQIGLLKDHNELQNRLAELSGMIQLGQQGIWLVLEESILEISKHKSACAYAATSLASVSSKHEAYQVFGRMQESNLGKAQAEEQLVLDEKGNAETEEAPPPSTIDWLMGRGTVKDEAMVITLLVVLRGGLDMRDNVESWQDVQHVLQQLCGLSSDKLMAIELLWTPREEGNFLTRKQMIRDYKELQPIR